MIYVTGGDPDFASSLEICRAIASAGADILELGVPFSDPLADGEANQLAAERAIASGMNQLKVLELACEIRKMFSHLPIVLFTYLNPIAFSKSMTLGEYCKKAKESGIDAMLPLDLPPGRDADEFISQIKAAGLGIVSLIAPNTPRERIPFLTKRATSFIYYVSREGVTGESSTFNANFAERISDIRACTSLPVVVGFGISTPDHVRAACSTGVDGIVIGSAIVRKIEAFSKGKGTIQDIAAFVKDLALATRKEHA